MRFTGKIGVTLPVKQPDNWNIMMTTIMGGADGLRPISGFIR